MNIDYWTGNENIHLDPILRIQTSVAATRRGFLVAGEGYRMWIPACAGMTTTTPIIAGMGHRLSGLYQSDCQ